MKKTRQIKLKEATKENKYLHQVLKKEKKKTYTSTMKIK